MVPNLSWQSLFDVEKILLGAICGFVLGIAGNLASYYWINRERRLRMLDRESKRHKFWQDFFETQASLPETARLPQRDIDQMARRCKMDLNRSYSIVMGHAKVANASGRVAGVMASGIMFLLVEFVTNGFFDKLFAIPRQMPGATTGQVVLTELLFQIAVLVALYRVVYSPVRDGVRDWLLDKQRAKESINQ